MQNALGKVLHSINTDTMKGIEIGPLHNPRLQKDVANVRYLDHCTADELRVKYAQNPAAAPYADQLVEVDFLWKPGLTLADAVGDWAPVDFVIASHLIEHIPDMVGWLHQVADILVDGGILSLVVPDKRYCFDAKRQETSLAQLVDAALDRRQVPTAQQIFDHEANFLGDVDTAALWNGLDPMPLRRLDVESPERFALERCLAQRETEEYVDVHCTTFTPHSFLRILSGLAQLDWLSFDVEHFYPTEPGSFEFYCTMRRLPRDLSSEERRDLQFRSLCQSADGGQPYGPRPLPDKPEDLMTLSYREEQLVRLKRRVSPVVRRVLIRGRRVVRGREPRC